MSFLSVMRAVAKNAGIRVPETVGANEPDQVKLSQFINETGQEAVRRVDWGSLRKVAVISADGSDSLYPMAGDYSRLAIGPSVRIDGVVIRGSLTPDEWFSLTPVQGHPRYYFLSGPMIGFYPYPESGREIRVQYQSANWVNGASDELSLDADEAMIPEDILIKGGIWRSRRHVGKDYADHMAEYESVLLDYAQFDSGTRTP